MFFSMYSQLRTTPHTHTLLVATTLLKHYRKKNTKPLSFFRVPFQARHSLVRVAVSLGVAFVAPRRSRSLKNSVFFSSSSLSFSLSLNYSTVLSRFLILFLASPSPLFSRGRVENRTLKASMISIIQIQKSSVFLNVEISVSHFFEQKSKQAKESEHASMHACWAWNTRAKRTWPRGLK